MGMSSGINGQKNNGNRRHKGARGPRPDRFEIKQKEATERNAVSDALSLAARINRVVERNDLHRRMDRFHHASARELARLTARLEAEAPSPKPEGKGNKKAHQAKEPAEPKKEKVLTRAEFRAKRKAEAKAS